MGANVNARTYDGYTPLHCASLNGDDIVVRVLLDAGAMVDAKCRSGWTPLYFAIRNKRVDVARLMVDQGAKLSNVKLDMYYVPAIPYWVTAFIESRSKCQSVSIVMIGIHKYRRTTVTGDNDINVIRLISKLIWSTRMDDAWKAKKKQIGNRSSNK
jgi:hypothetical protein